MTYQFNDMTDFDTNCDPGFCIEKFNEFNVDCADSLLKVEENEEKQWVKIIKEDKNE